MISSYTPEKLPSTSAILENIHSANAINKHNNNRGSNTAIKKITLPPLSTILSTAQTDHYRDHPLTPYHSSFKYNSPASSYFQQPASAATVAHSHSHPALAHSSISSSSSCYCSTPNVQFVPTPPPTTDHHPAERHRSVSEERQGLKRSSSFVDASDTSILEIIKNKPHSYSNSYANTSTASISSVTSATSTTSSASSSCSTSSSVLAQNDSKAYAFISHSPATFPSQEPAIDNAPLARRKRRRTSQQELNILNREFERGSTPNKSRRIEIAKCVRMTEKAVQIWFQNKRQSIRKQSCSQREVLELPPTTITIQEQQQQQQQQHEQHEQQKAVPIISSTPTKALPHSIPLFRHITPLHNQQSHQASTSLPRIPPPSTSSSTTTATTTLPAVPAVHNQMIETNKKQPHRLNGVNASTMTFKLIPSKVTRKILGEVTNRS
ncbi:uncharacterized protein LODBEIA_P57850 [Lodderomyces beijingensis]|uniref:Homeobox domain-containing protein n=1 Tax=Lodderomyces beijingensis TaxID=1775926 RepID=A0ABP0ZTU2_9ASCO